MLCSGSSYLSQSELLLTFGLAAQTKAESVEIHWPSGQVDKLSNVNAGQTITVQEGKGIVRARPYAKRSEMRVSLTAEFNPQNNRRATEEYQPEI